MKEEIYFITGSNRGIGLALTELALKRGHRVLGTTRTPEDSKALDKLQSEYGELLSIHWLDVTSETSVQECFNVIRSKGIHRIDVLINNAGMYGENQDKFLKLSVHSIINTFQVNTLGPMRVLQEGLSLLQKSSLGKMVGLSSKMGSIADNQAGGSYDYRMSKAALNMFHKNLSIEFPEMVSLLIHPGWVQTRMGGPNALISPQESAEGILKIIEKATLNDSGKFLDFQGKEIHW